ncbi:MAG: Bax inhibitor-1/YccA family protein [Alphaproteobacteria bacterium]|nr:Bax inhibitor-1/YccA family protein [Alphaproteobacteria bacterium]
MADFDNRIWAGAASGAGTIDTGLRAYMLKVYNYMAGALALTGVVAYGVVQTGLINLFYHATMTTNGVALQPTILGWVVMLAPLAMVFFLSFRIMHMSLPAAQATFWLYAGLVGASLSSILLVYTGASIALTFFVTAATFGAMSLWGYTTKRDLTGMGNFLMMGLIGILIAMLANMFFHSAAIEFVVSILGVLIFTGLTAWDTQKIKNTYYQVSHDGTLAGKMAVMGALSLYLDFLNIFLFLLRFLGDRR